MPWPAEIIIHAAGKNLSSSGLTVQALCVVPTPASGTTPCASAPTGFNWTSGLTTGTTYQLLFPVAGEDATSFHLDAGATFTLSL